MVEEAGMPGDDGLMRDVLGDHGFSEAVRSNENDVGGRVAPGITPRGSHGSGRAEFPHPALRDTASLHAGCHGRRQQRVALHESTHRVPGEATLRAAAQPAPPQRHDPMQKSPEPRPVALTPVIAVVAPKLLVQSPLLHRDAVHDDSLCTTAIFSSTLARSGPLRFASLPPICPSSGSSPSGW